MRDWAQDLDIEIGGETIMFVDCEAAFYRTSIPRATAMVLQRAGIEFGLMREQWCCGGPAAKMGYVEQSRRFAEHNVNDWRATGVKRIIAIEPHDFIHFTEDYPAILARSSTSRLCKSSSSLLSSSARADFRAHQADRPPVSRPTTTHVA